MSWNEVYNKFRFKFTNLASGSENSDRDSIVEIIMDTFPFYSREHVESAYDYCSNSVNMNRTDVLDRLSRVL